MANNGRSNVMLVILVSSIFSLNAAIPTGYYASVDGRQGDNIVEALYQKINEHTNVGYDGLYDVYKTSDNTAEGYVWDMYSTCTFAHINDKCGGYKKVCDCYNREHSVPASWFKDASPMYSDPFHVIPTDGYVNNQRSNYPLGECVGGSSAGTQSLCRRGTSSRADYSGTVFEVPDQYKGDFARAYFYMVTCYRNRDFTSANGTAMFTYKSSVAGLTSYAVNLLMDWHRLDPVSEKEIDRNNAIYAAQGNRNPYIDYPCLAEYIWGESRGEKVVLDELMSSSDEAFLASDRTGCHCKVSSPTILSPKANTNVVIGSSSVGEPVSSIIHVSGILFTSPVTVSLSGDHAKMFTLSAQPMVIPADSINDGFNLKVTYTPDVIGQHSCTLSFSSTDLEHVHAVTITGNCKAELVEPVTGTELMMVAQGVGTTMSQSVFVKATNLTSAVYVGIGSGDKSVFSVSPSLLTASQANAGTWITVSYTPSALGNHTAELILNSTNSEFARPNIQLKGSCLFALLPEEVLSSSSVRLSWVNGGKECYALDVYQKTIIPGEPQETFSDVNGAKGITSGYTAIEGNQLRLGSGSSIGVLTYTDLDLSQGGELQLEARYYGSDNSLLKVVVDGEADTLTLTADLLTYTIPFSEGKSTTSKVVIETLEKKKRAFVHQFSVITGGSKEVRTHVTGYPCEICNTLSADVVGLWPDVEYHYSVTPVGLMSYTEEGSFVPYSGTTESPVIPLSDVEDVHKIISNGHLYILMHGEKYNAVGIKCK